MKRSSDALQSRSATNPFMRITPTGGLALFYLVAWGLRLFGFHIPLLHEMIYGANWLGIGFSALAVLITAANLVLDFAFIEENVREGAPKHLEWYAAFGLIVTLLWLYLEVLHLLMKLASAFGGSEDVAVE